MNTTYFLGIWTCNCTMVVMIPAKLYDPLRPGIRRQVPNSSTIPATFNRRFSRPTFRPNTRPNTWSIYLHLPIGEKAAEAPTAQRESRARERPLGRSLGTFVDVSLHPNDLFSLPRIVPGFAGDRGGRNRGVTGGIF